MSGAVYDAVFRAMAKAQDRPDEVKYLFYRMIGLMVVIHAADLYRPGVDGRPFMLFVYGAKWVPSADPLRIVSLAGLLICIGHPCGAVLAAMNRLGREVWIHIAQGVLVSVACYYGLKHSGISGAAWGVFAGIAFPPR